MSFVDRSSSVRLDDTLDKVTKDQRHAVLTEIPEASAEKTKPKNPLIAFKYADKTDILLMTISWVCAAGLGVCPPLNMLVMGNGISGAGTGDNGLFDKMIMNFVILGAVALVLGYITVVLNEMAAERQIRRIKKAYVDTIMRQEVGYFDVKDVGSLASAVESSCVQVREGNGMKSGQIVRSVCMFIGGYAVGLSKDWAMALLMTVAIPLIGLSFATLINFLNKSVKQSREEYAKAGSVAEETLPAIRTVAAFGLEDIFRARFDALVQACEKSDLSGALWKSGCLGITFLILYGSYALGWWWGGRTVHKKLIDSNGTNLGYGGTVMSTFFAIMMSAFSLAAIAPNLSAVTSSAAAIVEIDELIGRKSLIDPTEPGGQTRDALSGEIEFKEVRFAYPSRPERDIYQNVSFKIKAGDTVALVGPSGAGKSTVIQLIERFYDPTGGEILMDGVASTDYNLQWLRKQMALVSQEPRLFCTTIRQNIAYGKPGATEPEIIAAAKAANAHTFIMNLSDGYDTNVGQGGSLLSGGQKQRIAIARAIIRNPPILILDEATSALDNQSEKIVQQALDELVVAKKRTTIIIAHRLTTIRNADRIIVVSDVRGKGSMVVEEGVHHDLMEIEGGIYRALVDAQSGKKDDVSSLAPMNFLTSKGWSATLSSRFSRQISKTRFGSFVSREASRIKSIAGDEEVVKPRKATHKLYRQLGGDWPFLLIGFIGAAAVGASSPVNALILSAFLGTFFTYDPDKSVLDNANYVQDKTNTLSLYYVALACAVGVAMTFMSYSFDHTGYCSVSRLRQRVFHNVVYQDMEFFDDPQHNTGAISSVLSGDCETVKTILGPNLSTSIENAVSMIAALVIGLISNWRLALVAVAAYVLMIPAAIMQNRLVKSTSSSMGSVDEEDTPAFVMNEIFTNLKIVACFGLQDEMSRQYDQALVVYYKRGMRNAYVTAAACALSDCLMFFANAIAYGYASHLLKTTNLQLEKMMRCLLSIMMAGNGVSRTAAFTTDEKKAEVACENIFGLIERKPKIDARSILGSTKTLRGKIEVQNIKFRYPGRPNVPIMDDVSFDVKAGTTVALVGESGSGKSTIIQLLERFYDVEASDVFKAKIREHNEEIDKLGTAQEGEKDLRRLDSATDMFNGQLRLEGVNIIDMNTRHLRSSIGLVGQEPVLFDVTVEENIKYGKLDATSEEVCKAAQMANAEEFILRLPEGYQTKVGKGGGLLSGGQKQRVAIARAIIRDPKLLLLDEATSALDPESEEIVQKALDDLLQKSKRTTIVIAHRLSTVRNADKIVVFAPQPGTGSKVVEQGNHEELMRRPNGVYRNLVNIANNGGN